MGNIGSSFFLTPQEKEFRKLTKKNTKVNRMSSCNNDFIVPVPTPPKDPERKKRLAMQPLRFENLITEVTYDREAGEIEVTRESLNLDSEDALGSALIMDLVPTTVPVVSANDEPSQRMDEDASIGRRARPMLKRDSSFVSAHAKRHTHWENAEAAGAASSDTPN